MSTDPSGPKNETEAPHQNPYADTELHNSVIARLEHHGIDYQDVRRIVDIGVPASLFYFATRFGRRTIKSVLDHIDGWKKHLTREYLLSEDEKATIERWILMHEGMVWKAVREINTQIGDWIVSAIFTPPGVVETIDGERVCSGETVNATNQTTHEVRTFEIRGERPAARRSLGDIYKEMYTALGVIDDLWLDAPYPLFMNDRKAPQGRPVYARIIPRLYDFMLPHYRSRAHHSLVLDAHVAGQTKRSAAYPKELLEDMVDILRMHHPHVFGRTTLGQLKAHIQHYRERKAPLQGTPRKARY